MGKFSDLDTSHVSFRNKNYTVIKIPYKKEIVPIVLDKKIYNKIKSYDGTWNINNYGNVYTLKDNKILFLHEVVYILHNNKKNNVPLVHLNKIGLDNRIENLITDGKNKEIRKNLNKKSRTIELENIDVSRIPSFVWYLKPDATHGERFQVELGDIKWKCTSCNKLSLKYKLEETKKYLRQYKQRNPIEFEKHSMNSDMNIYGLNNKKDFYKIIEKAGMFFEYNLINNTDELLKEDKTNLSSIEKKLLRQFDIDSDMTTYQRLELLY